MRLGAVWVGMKRILTLKQLNDAHPLPEGWTWADDPSVGWHARYPGGYTVCIDASDDVVALYDGTRHFYDGTRHFEPPRRVCLEVILASDGLDSREAMAANVAARIQRLVPAVGATSEAVAWARFGREALGEVEAMLRRGTVEVQP